jgi:hypothetical protein
MVKKEEEKEEKENNECYNFEDILNQNGLFDECIDATYIIHLEGNEERKSNITNQLNLYQPTKKVHILNNKGFKKCKKNLKEQSPRCDLIDCFIKVFKDAEEKNYNNVLILEDDFVFSEKIKEKKNVDEISNFLNKCTSIDQNFIYLLGCVPYLQIPSLIRSHTRVLASTGTHASIYSRKFRDNILRTPQNEIDDWDVYTNLNSLTFRYIYKIPLCYQLFYETDNFHSWDDRYNVKYFMMSIFKKMNMDKTPEPGFSYFYWISRLIFFILLFLIYYGVKTIVNLIIYIVKLFINQFNFVLSFFVNKF